MSIRDKIMNRYIIVMAFSVVAGIVYGEPDFKTTDWIPKGNQKFVDAGTKVITLLDGKDDSSVTIKPDKIYKVTVILKAEARSKDGWILDERYYNLGSSGAPIGQMPEYITQGDDDDFYIGFDKKLDESNNGKSTTLYGQVVLKGHHPKLSKGSDNPHTDIGIAGKDTGITITLKY